MKENAKHILYLFCVLSISLFPIKTLDLKDHDAEAGQTRTLENLLQKRKNFIEDARVRDEQKTVRVLIVAGHDDEVWGTEFRSLKEVELNRKLAARIYEYLSREKGINPVLVSDEGGYLPFFERYFRREESQINRFIERAKKNFSRRLDREETSVDTDFHNVATENVAFKLYGINRWVNEQKFDLVIHIHFNDYRGRKWGTVGKYEGFSIYTPGELFENHGLSRALADSVFGELKKIRPISNFEPEKDGIIETHELIAIGSNETLEVGSILVEYGYIYENVFTDPEKQPISLDYLAYATYAGVMRTLNETPIPKAVETVSTTRNENTEDNLKWQYQKALEGKYPPEGKTLEDCPIGGYFGACSQAVK